MSGSGYTPPIRETDLRFDLNRDGKVEDWELVGDSPPIVFGLVSIVMTVVHFIVYFTDNNTSFTFDTFYNAGSTLSFIFSLSFDTVQLIIFLVYILDSSFSMFKMIYWSSTIYIWAALTIRWAHTIVFIIGMIIDKSKAEQSMRL